MTPRKCLKLVHPNSTLRKTTTSTPHRISFTSPQTMTRSPSLSGPMGSLPLPSFIQKRLFTETPRTKSLNINNINQNVVHAEYAVRGELAIKSEQYRAQLAKGEGKDLPFDSVISANIGNPQQLDQKPITFFRQVTSLLENPQLLEHEDVLTDKLGYKPDVIERAQRLLKDVKSVGAYSQSQGAPGIRQSVADFIERRDGYSADPANIYLCAGASSGVNALMNVICATPNTGVLVPIPQYPLYSATLRLMNAHMVPYYLKEDANWATDVGGMREALKEAQGRGIDVRAVVVINPGNPTGGSLKPEAINEVLELAAEEKLVMVADEVYQTNVFEGEFQSFKKGLRDLQKSEKNTDGKFDNVELASLHSISKGMVGECGHRGGYYEMIGFDPEVSFPNTPLSLSPTNTNDIPGDRTNLQIRQHNALRPRNRPVPRRLHGLPPAPRLPLPPPLRTRIQLHLHRSPPTRHRPLRRLRPNGRRAVPIPSGLDVPLPDNFFAGEGCGSGEGEGEGGG